MAEMKMNNARDPEQRRRMEEAERKGVCYFCEAYKNWDRHAGDPPPSNGEKFLHVGNHWFVKRNDFPYEGAKHHYLIISRQHITKLSELDKRGGAGIELFNAIQFIESILGVEGYSIFVRSGNMSYTGATLDHLHFHFLVGAHERQGTEKIKVTLGYKEPQ